MRGQHDILKKQNASMDEEGNCEQNIPQVSVTPLTKTQFERNKTKRVLNQITLRHKLILSSERLKGTNKKYRLN